jgi:hypothetical protein
VHQRPWLSGPAPRETLQERTSLEVCLRSTSNESALLISVGWRRLLTGLEQCVLKGGSRIVLVVIVAQTMLLQHLSILFRIYKAVQHLELQGGSREVKRHASVPQSEIGIRQVLEGAIILNLQRVLFSSEAIFHHGLERHFKALFFFDKVKIVVLMRF